MARLKTLKEPVRINMMIERSVEKQLKKLAKKTNINMSEHIRHAIDDYFGNDNCKSYKMTKEFEQVIQLLELIKFYTPRDGSTEEIELKRSQLMLMFGREWSEIKSIVNMTESIFRAKGFDVIFEEIILSIIVPGTDRTKMERYGFKFFFVVPVTKAMFNKLITDIKFEAQKYGMIKEMCGDETDDS